MNEPNSLKCPRCDHPLNGAEPNCPGCGRPLGKKTGLVGALKVAPCPICKIPLYHATLDDQEVLHCAECKGIGIRREAMMKLQSQGNKEVQIGAEERQHKTPAYFEPRQKPPFLICPFCAKRMEALKLGKTELNQCEKCGSLWLEEPKLGTLPEIIGPYKFRISQSKNHSGRR